MKINKNEKIVGISILKIRDLLKTKSTIDKDAVIEKFSLSDKDASMMINELEHLGYIVAGEDKLRYKKTLLGRSLSLAKAIPPIDRKKADELFSAFMKRVSEVNENEYYLYRVERVILFGSYITDAAMVNDIDIAVDLNRREEDEDIFEMKSEKRLDEAYAEGKTFRNILDECYYPEKQVLLYLKAKEKYLSMHTGRDGILRSANVRQVFP